MPASPSPQRAVYREAGRTYVADSCRALVEAAEAGSVQLHALGRAGYPGRRLPAAALPGLRGIGWWDAGQQQSWGLPLHRNEGIEITFLASGEIAARVDDRSQTLHHDELLITRPWQPHQLGNPCVGPSRLAWIILDVGVRRPHQTWRWPSWVVLSRPDLAELTRCLRQNETFIWPGSPDIRRCFLGIARAVEQEDAVRATSRLAVLINEVLLAVLDHFRARRIPLRASLTSAERTLRQFVKELDATLDQPWTLETMAASCHLGTTQFVHHFRHVTNLPPNRYLAQRRVHRACELLVKEPGAAITDIALRCGFSSSQYFANVFTRQTGKSPRVYRQTRLTP